MNNEKLLDIAQRIAEAIARTTEPKPLIPAEPMNPTADMVLGEVPLHLRHLHNLLGEIGEEMREAEVRFMEAKKRRSVVHALFFDALEHHVPSRDGEYAAVKLCEGWQVVGQKQSEEDTGMSGFAEMFAMALGARG